MSNLGRLGFNPQKGTMPVLQWMPPSMLAIDGSYQRTIDNPASQKLILRIAKFWDWDLCQPLVVSRRPDGTQWIVDGQHRLAAAVLRGDIQQLPCFICNYPDAATEAQRFVDFNRNRKALKPLDLWKAAVAAEEPDTMAIIGALDAAGMHVHHSSNNHSMPPGAVTAIGALQRTVAKYGVNVLQVSLMAIAKAYEGQVLQYNGTMIGGSVAIVARECGDATALDWQGSPSFAELINLLGGTSQRDWYEKIAEVKKQEPDLNFQRAINKCFTDAWANRGREIVAAPPPPVARLAPTIEILRKPEPAPAPKPASIDPLAKAIIEKHGIARPAGAKA